MSKWRLLRSAGGRLVLFRLLLRGFRDDANFSQCPPQEVQRWIVAPAEVELDDLLAHQADRRAEFVMRAQESIHARKC